MRVVDAVTAFENEGLRIVLQERRSQLPRMMADNLALLKLKFEQLGIAHLFDWDNT